MKKLKMARGMWSRLERGGAERLKKTKDRHRDGWKAWEIATSEIKGQWEEVESVHKTVRGQCRSSEPRRSDGPNLGSTHTGTCACC